MQDHKLFTVMNEKKLQEYQFQLLLSIGFVYSKADVEWFDNYARLSGECCNIKIFEVSCYFVPH